MIIFIGSSIYLIWPSLESINALFVENTPQLTSLCYLMILLRLQQLFRFISLVSFSPDSRTMSSLYRTCYNTYPSRHLYSEAKRSHRKYLALEIETMDWLYVTVSAETGNRYKQNITGKQIIFRQSRSLQQNVTLTVSLCGINHCGHGQWVKS